LMLNSRLFLVLSPVLVTLPLLSWSRASWNFFMTSTALILWSFVRNSRAFLMSQVLRLSVPTKMSWP
jgi:hypothetical protein